MFQAQVVFWCAGGRMGTKKVKQKKRLKKKGVTSSRILKFDLISA